MSSKDDMAPDTLFLPFDQGVLPWPDAGIGTLFAGARPHAALAQIPGAALQQFFKPYADALAAGGLSAQPVLPEGGDYDLALALLPKSQQEAEVQLASVLLRLKPGGMIVCAADNKAGGSRLEKTLTALGLSGVQSMSKHKARVCWAVRGDLDAARLQKIVDGGALQEVLGGQFVSQPGIFGWDKIDQGSAMLAAHLPPDLKGAGADFGCGYGYLSRMLVQMPKVKSLICADADHRAVQACQKNLEGTDKAVRFEWLDLAAQTLPFKNLDFIVMNPPFHEGKLTDSAIGVRFIINAAAALRAGGKLFMVANVHLPYEAILAQHFSSHTKLYEGVGFKIYMAVKS